MIPRISSGRSFKWCSFYLGHDPKAQTAERLAWTHTINCANEHVGSAVHELYSTYIHAHLLKEEHGIRAGGRQLENPVKHLSLNWHPSEEPTREQMIEAVQSVLEHMGWEEHQAILYAHDDKEYRHVHVMLCAIHPETGLKLDDSFEKRRLQQWALSYEREHGHIFCQQRLLEPEQREPAPTRETWLALKEAEREHEQAEQARRAYDPDYLGREDNRRLAEKEEWQLLRAHQREEREAFFAEGKQAFRELRNQIYLSVREQLRPEWGDFYAAKREGLAPEPLAAMRADILERQNTMLDERCREDCAVLRGLRDEEYAELLATHRQERAELRDRQERGLSSPHLLEFAGDPRMAGPLAEANATTSSQNSEAGQKDRTSDPAGGFGAAADEVCSDEPRGAEREEPSLVDDPPGMTWAENPRVRDPANSVGDLGMSMVGALATVVERLFDGFLGGGTPGSGKNNPAPRQASREPTEERPDPARARAAEAAQRTTEQQEEERRSRTYWEDRDRSR
jgi:Relaxase/Mobilisation nuclease domain